MANVFRDIAGVLGGILQFAIGGFKLKNSSGTAQFRNAGDTDYTDVEAQELTLYKSGSANGLTLQSPTLAAPATLVLPATGTIPNNSGMHYSKIISFSQASSSPLTLDSAPPANGTLAKVRLMTDTAASGGTPTLTVGISGTPARDMATTDNNLKAVGQYINEPMLALGGSPGAIIATIVSSSQTFAGRIQLEYVMP